MPPEEIIQHIDGLREQAEGIEQQIMELAIYSDGTLSHDTITLMSFEMRERAIKTLNKKFERMSGKEFM